jgi:hypothetical protein
LCTWISAPKKNATSPLASRSAIRRVERPISFVAEAASGRETEADRGVNKAEPMANILIQYMGLLLSS